MGLAQAHPNYHLSSVSTCNGEATQTDTGPSPYPSLPDIGINIAGVTNFPKEINHYKATVPDCNPTNVLKQMVEELSPSLALIITVSLPQRKIPQDWKSPW